MVGLGGRPGVRAEGRADRDLLVWGPARARRAHSSPLRRFTARSWAGRWAPKPPGLSITAQEFAFDNMARFLGNQFTGSGSAGAEAALSQQGRARRDDEVPGARRRPARWPCDRLIQQARNDADLAKSACDDARNVKTDRWLRALMMGLPPMPKTGVKTGGERREGLQRPGEPASSVRRCGCPRTAAPTSTARRRATGARLLSLVWCATAAPQAVGSAHAGLLRDADDDPERPRRLRRRRRRLFHARTPSRTRKGEDKSAPDARKDGLRGAAGRALRRSAGRAGQLRAGLLQEERGLPRRRAGLPRDTAPKIAFGTARRPRS